MIIRDGPYEQLWAFPCDNSVISVAATPNCSLISAATVGCSVYLLDDEGNLLWKNKEPLDNEGWATALSADGKLVAVGTANKKPSDGAIHVFGSDGSSVWSRRVRAPVWSLSFSADGKTLAAACWNDHLYLCVRSGPGYDVREINLSKHGVTGGLYGVKLSPNGLVCVVAAYDRGLFVFDRDGELLQRVDSNEGLYNITICENTSKIVAGTRGGSFLVCDLENSGPPNCRSAYRSGRFAASRRLPTGSWWPAGVLMDGRCCQLAEVILFGSLRPKERFGQRPCLVTGPSSVLAEGITRCG